ncbi:MAG TPA: hypothetical protein PK360_15700 [bacterium]|nr:hypothetical protein [bacterium]
MLRLTESQKHDVIRTLRDLASLDREFDLLEAVRIRLIGLKMDLHAAKIDECMAEDTEPLDKIRKRLERFKDENQKKYLYQQCLLLLMADGKISEVEKSAMDEIRTDLGIDPKTHQQILSWVEEGMKWEKRGEELAGGPLEGDAGWV